MASGESSDPDAGSGRCKAGVFCSPLQSQRLDVDCEEAFVATGGFHATRDTRDSPDSDLDQDTGVHRRPGVAAPSGVRQGLSAFAAGAEQKNKNQRVRAHVLHSSRKRTTCVYSSIAGQTSGI